MLHSIASTPYSKPERETLHPRGNVQGEIYLGKPQTAGKKAAKKGKRHL